MRVLPWRDTVEEAQHDLDLYAERKGMHEASNVGSRYIYRGKEVFVADLFTGNFRTVWVSETGDIHIVATRELPLRRTRKTAQQDLDRFAAKRKLKEA